MLRTAEAFAVRSAYALVLRLRSTDRWWPVPFRLFRSDESASAGRNPNPEAPVSPNLPATLAHYRRQPILRDSSALHPECCGFAIAASTRQDGRLEFRSQLRYSPR